MKNEKEIQEQFSLIARQYDEGRRCFIPCFDDYYVRSVSLLKVLRPRLERVADLGAGTGLLTEQLFRLYPNAHFTLIDLSDEMLDVARRRFEGLDNFDYRVENFVHTIGDGYDCLCSALSIHHLEDDEKRQLYRSIHAALPVDGCFLTLDQFCADSSQLTQAYDDWWIHYINHSGITPEARARWEQRRQLDREVSVSATIAMLREAGFRQVQCVYAFMKFATIIALK